MEQIKRTRRIRQTGVGTAVAALAAFAIWQIWPRERLLMEVARPVIGADIEQAEFCWLSVHHLLLVTTKHEALSGKDRNGHPVYKDWQGSVDVFDTITHTSKHMAALTNLIEQTTTFPHSDPNLFETSPDGSWLQWQTSVGGHGRPSTRVAHLDGSYYRGWNASRVEEEFFMDARHLVQMAGEEPVMTICDLLDPSQDKQYKKPDQAKAILAQYAIQQPVFVTFPDSAFNQNLSSAEIDAYRTEDRIALLLALHDDKQQPSKPIQALKVKLPEGARLRWITVSPQQKSILYHLRISRTPPLLTWLHRILPKIDMQSIENEGLWISRSDGRGMHEIGHLPVPLDANDFNDDLLDYFRWLPDGRQISFVYHSILYVVPAELEK